MHDFQESPIIHAIANRGNYTAIPAFMLALACLIQIGIMVFRWSKARNWIPLRARLLKINDSSSEGIDTERLGKINKISAQYEFLYNGSHYKGSKVSAGIGYRPQLYRDLVESFEEGQEITIFINPKIPEKSMIDRDLYWPEILVVGGLGMIGAVIGIWSLSWMVK